MTGLKKPKINSVEDFIDAAGSDRLPADKKSAGSKQIPACQGEMTGKPTENFLLRLNRYERCLFAFVAKAEHLSQQQLLREIVIHELEKRASNIK